jgi:FkbM family methyltransferase
VWHTWTPGWRTQIVGRLLSERPGTFVDVGANWGQTLIDYLAAAERRGYVGFEPNVECASWTQALISRNDLSGCVMVPAAAGASPGLIDLLVTPETRSMSDATVRHDLRPMSAASRRTSVVTVVDEALLQLGIDDVTIVKVDAEGAELEALSGMQALLTTQRPHIICEVLLADAYADMEEYAARLTALEALLDAARYRTARIRFADASWCDLDRDHPFPRARWHDAATRACDYLLYPT